MTNSDLLRSFKFLTKQDHLALCDLAATPFFNKKEGVTRLCRYLADNVQRTTPKLFDKEKLYEAALLSGS